MSPLPNVAALLAKATPVEDWYRNEDGSPDGPGWPDGGVGRMRLADRSRDMAAALIECEKALREIAEVETWGKDDRWVTPWTVARFALARLVAFDASLKETTE